MAFFHGVRSSEVPTSLLSPVEVDSAITVAWGTAPIHLAKNPAKANEPILCYELSEYVDKFGDSDDFDKYTLAEVASSQFQLYRVSPTIFINVLDPDKHYNEREITLAASLDNPVELDTPMLLDTLKITSDGTETFYCNGSEKGKKFAECVQKQLIDSLGTVNRGIKTNSLYVTNHTDAPAILIELAFIDNPSDAKLLVEKEEEFARAIARGVTDYLQGTKPIPDVVDKPTVNVEIIGSLSAKYISKENFHLEKHSDALKAVIFSRAVQNGVTGCKDLFVIACQKLGQPNLSYIDDTFFDGKIISAIYDFLIS